MLIISCEKLYLSFYIINKTGETTKSIDLKIEDGASYEDFLLKFISVTNFLECQDSLMQVAIIAKKNVISDYLEKISNEYLKISPIMIDGSSTAIDSNLEFSLPPSVLITMQSVIEKKQLENFIYIHFSKSFIYCFLNLNGKIEDVKIFINPLFAASLNYFNFSISEDVPLSNLSTTEDFAISSGSIISLCGSIDCIIRNFKSKVKVKNIQAICFSAKNHNYLQYCEELNSVEYDLLNKAVLNYILS